MYIIGCSMIKINVKADLIDIFHRKIRGGKTESSAVIYMPKYLVGREVYVILKEVKE